MAEKYLNFDIKAFVDSNPNIRWCPHPGCGQAVSMAPPTSEDMASPPLSTDPAVTVHCGHDHYFCWGCSGEPHEPCDCEQWKTWLNHIEEMKPKIGDTTMAEVDEAASNKWLASRSKPCPKCRAPIERTEGCNHMCCRKCRHNFCWVCLGTWKIHGSRTGGYFDCNRYRATRNADKRLQQTREAVSQKEKRQHTKYFKHLYSRYLNHTHSLRYEENLLGSVDEKAAALMAAALGSCASIQPKEVDGKFVEDAVRELLKARMVLRSSYALSYFISSDSAKNQLIKLLAPLEKSTEMLAEMIARPHLRTPKDKIVLSTVESREVRRKFLLEARGMNPRKPSETLDLEDEDLDPTHPNRDLSDLSDLSDISDSFDTDDWDEDDDDDDWDSD